jgi:DNA mismatch repair protein MutS
VFSALDAFFVRHQPVLDETIQRFDKEVQFYLAYLDYIAPLKAAGVAFCLPTVLDDPSGVSAEDAVDLVLAKQRVTPQSSVVGNDFVLAAPERILVVTGPNQGGKTTFARLFGQLHYLAALGLAVPAARATLALADSIFTHFERQETLDTLRGKLEDEVVRVHDILGAATRRSVVVMNETFTSTTLDDALFLGRCVIERMTELGVLGVYVTFVDELASMSPAAVSMVAMVDPDRPTERTFKIARRPADGLAYAGALADKYGLSYQALTQRLAS